MFQAFILRNIQSALMSNIINMNINSNPSYLNLWFNIENINFQKLKLP